MNEEVPFDIIDNFPETGDLTGQTGNDVIDAFQKVRFTIMGATAKLNQKEGVIKTGSVSMRVAISSLGVDGEGKYANKNLFQDLTSYVNTEVLTSDWWKKNAMFPYKTFLKSLGYDIANPPKVNDAYFTALKGREFIADIKKEAVTAASGNLKSNGKAEYLPTGDFKNTLTNFKAVE